MLPFNDALGNDNPISDSLDLESLRVWYIALLLIASNLPGFLTVIYGYTISEYVVSVAVFVAMIISIFYHLCQTTNYCFMISLSLWTLADHISAPSMAAMIMIFL